MSMKTTRNEFSLTKKEQAFSDAYLLTGNKRASAIAAGAAPNSASTTAARMCANVRIQKYLAIRQKELNKQLNEDFAITKDRILQEVAAAAFFDPGKMYDSDGNMLSINKMDEATRRAIAAFDVSEITDQNGALIGYVKRIKLVSKMAALELAGRYLKLWNSENDPEKSILNIVINTHTNQLDNPPQHPINNRLWIESE